MQELTCDNKILSALELIMCSVPSSQVYKCCVHLEVPTEGIVSLIIFWTGPSILVIFQMMYIDSPCNLKSLNPMPDYVCGT
jgi:hypothetical protein